MLICQHHRLTRRQPGSAFQLHFSHNSAPVQLHFSHNSAPVQLRFSSGSAPVQLRFSSGSAPVQLRFSSGSTVLAFRASAVKVTEKAPKNRAFSLLDELIIALDQFKRSFFFYCCVFSAKIKGSIT